MSYLINSLNHQGKGITRIDNKVVFVNNALTDEVVDINIIKENKKFSEAIVLDYEKISNDRVSVKCPYYDVCGGCDIMHMNYKAQLDFKKNKVSEIISKFTKEDILINDIIYGEQFNYRNKATFHAKEKIGFYKEKSYEIIDVDKCLISSNKINEVLLVLKKLNLKNVNSIVIRCSYDNDSVMVILDIMDSINENMFIDGLKYLVNSLYVVKDKNYKLIYGDKYIIDKIGDLDFVISPDSFFQVNTNMAYKLYSKVLKYANCSKEDSVLDLYCGTGTIGLFLADSCKEVIGVELNKYAISDANYNMKLNGIKNAKFICGDSGKVLNGLKYKSDIVIVDPPRSGLDSLAINQVLSLNPKRIVYVSCDPVTLARDLNILKEKYDILEITPVDMFPNTNHVECVSLLCLKTRENNRNTDK